MTLPGVSSAAPHPGGAARLGCLQDPPFQDACCGAHMHTLLCTHCVPVQQEVLHTVGPALGDRLPEGGWDFISQTTLEAGRMRGRTRGTTLQIGMGGPAWHVQGLVRSLECPECRACWLALVVSKGKRQRKPWSWQRQSSCAVSGAPPEPPSHPWGRAWAHLLCSSRLPAQEGVACRAEEPTGLLRSETLVGPGAWGLPRAMLSAKAMWP